MAQNCLVKFARWQFHVWSEQAESTHKAISIASSALWQLPTPAVRQVQHRKHRCSWSTSFVLVIIRPDCKNHTFNWQIFQFFSSPMSGVPHDVLVADYWVPNSVSRSEHERFKNKDTYRQILTTSETTCMAYFERATKDTIADLFIAWSKLVELFSLSPWPQDFCRKASKSSSTKTKDLCWG